MDLSIKSIFLLGAVFLTGLSAGLFFAWSISVIPGTQRVTDEVYLQTMQSINRAILNPVFFAVFFGSVLLLGLSSIYEFHSSKLVFSFFLAASITYSIGTIGVTGLGNVPLNDQLETMDLTSLTEREISAFRTFYETKWNKLHAIRTGFAVLSFLLALIGLLIDTKKM